MGSLQTFINPCLRNVLNVRWPRWRTMGQEEANVIRIGDKKTELGLVRHSLRKPVSNVTRQALDPQGKRADQNSFGAEALMPSNPPRPTPSPNPFSPLSVAATLGGVGACVAGKIGNKKKR
ncbi:hypothetical protein ElyMa_004552800 [Elysia marginata]|uniref:Uncharacterized protein n=1 Tax=Elysia marginata TaxID=1093978 RepID=A0AAV4HSC4_9GAST|nr:hypothetical protein ElyMa_004552800 [Elysia marginata]